MLTDAAAISRSSASEPPRSPAARAWTSTLPSAVASSGPAITGNRAQIGGELAQQLVAHAAADDVQHIGREPVTSASRSSTKRYLHASESRIERTVSPGSAGGC